MLFEKREFFSEKNVVYFCPVNVPEKHIIIYDAHCDLARLYMLRETCWVDFTYTGKPDRTVGGERIYRTCCTGTDHAIFRLGWMFAYDRTSFKGIEFLPPTLIF